MIRRLTVLLGLAAAGWFLFTRLRPRPAAVDWDEDEAPMSEAPPASGLMAAEPATGSVTDDGVAAEGEVKGNIRPDGEKIYHLPGDPAYARTIAEQTFASAEEAEAAGFRRAGHHAD